MLQSEVFPYYRKYRDELTEVHQILKSNFEADYVSELASIRGYVSQQQLDLIEEMQLGICSIDPSLFEGYSSELNLLTQTGRFLLDNRFIIPVTMPNGDLVSLIGYYPDKRKYITIPTPFFSRECLFFNFEQAYGLSWGQYDGFVILVEGIFDCLSLRSIGLPAIATMGATVSKIKCELLKLFRKVLAIPDDDATGSKAIDPGSKLAWNVPSTTTFLRFKGGTLDIGGVSHHCKDMDNFVSWYDMNDVREILLSYSFSKELIEELTL